MSPFSSNAYAREYMKVYLPQYRKTHPRRYQEKDSRVQMEKRHLLKLEVLGFYTNPKGKPICNNCGEQDIDVLCLDHINGGGSKHVAGLTTTLYNWVKREGFPQGFQVLCANCNLKKQRFERKYKTPEIINCEVFR